MLIPEALSRVRQLSLFLGAPSESDVRQAGAGNRGEAGRVDAPVKGADVGGGWRMRW